MTHTDQIPIVLQQSDALLVIDIQNDFLTDGALTVPGANEIIALINAYIAKFEKLRRPVFVTRDWHPERHCSFISQGGPWPAHCIAETTGAQFAEDLSLPNSTTVISKGVSISDEGYSAFDNTAFKNMLDHLQISRLFVCGVAIEYCVQHTVLDALKYHFQVYLLIDAMRAVNLNLDDGKRALRKMTSKGASPITWEMLE